MLRRHAVAGLANEALTKKTPVAAGVFGSSKYLRSGGNKNDALFGRIRVCGRQPQFGRHRFRRVDEDNFSCDLRPTSLYDDGPPTRGS